MSNSWQYVYKFVADMVQRLSNQDLRVSIITFSCKGNIILPITGNREEILKGVERLKYSIPAGHEHIYLGLWKANKQIKKINSGDVQRPSMIISLLNSPLDDEIYKYSMEEANDARKLGASVYCVGVGYSDTKQIIGLAGEPQNAYTDKKAEHLNDLIFPIASKACPSLQASDTHIICIRESNPVILRGYGFDFAVRKEEVICRFHFYDMDGSFKDVKAINLTKTTVTCPGPIVDQPGKVIYILLSLDNGRNFLNNNAFVASKLCGKDLFTVKTTTATTTRRPTTKTTRTTTTKMPSTTTTTLITTTTTLITATSTPTTAAGTATSLMTTASPTTIPLVTEELKPSGDVFIFAPILLGLLLTLLLIGCLWQLCCLPPVEEPPPPKPQPQPRKKQQPPPPVSPPAPAPPVNPAPSVIVCCCTCRGLSVSRDVEGRCTSFALLKALCAQDPCSPRVSLPPSQEHLPLASCSQCRQFPVSCCSFPSRLSLVTPPSWIPRAWMSIPPMYYTSQGPQRQN